MNDGSAMITLTSLGSLQNASQLDKSCLFRMRLLDSFLKESARMDCFPTTLRRIALRDVRFRDGTLLPQGVLK